MEELQEKIKELEVEIKDKEKEIEVLKDGLKQIINDIKWLI